MNTTTQIHRILSIVVASGLFTGLSVVNAADAFTEFETTLITKESVQNPVYSEGVNDFRNRVPICKSTAKGTRCKNTGTWGTDEIAFQNTHHFGRYQIRTEKTCNESSRGKRCTLQMDFPLMENSGDQLVFTKHSICKKSSRGSRCHSKLLS